MKHTLSELAVIPIAVLLVGGALWFILQPEERVLEPREVPDFASITDVRVKKETFFEFMLPMVRSANDRVRRERLQLERLIKLIQVGHKLSEKESEALASIKTRYRVTSATNEDNDTLNELLSRVDTIPASLVLAQAANESAWGTARFARNGRNYFGIWCWTAECGLVPKQRDEGARHEVAAFKTIEDSVDYYLLTINSHPAYDMLREIRTTFSNEGKSARGWDLAAGLLNYSERREAYVDEIRAMIEINRLERFSRLNFDH